MTQRLKGYVSSRVSVQNLEITSLRRARCIYQTLARCVMDLTHDLISLMESEK